MVNSTLTKLYLSKFVSEGQIWNVHCNLHIKENQHETVHPAAATEMCGPPVQTLSLFTVPWLNQYRTRICRILKLTTLLVAADCGHPKQAMGIIWPGTTYNEALENAKILSLNDRQS